MPINFTTSDKASASHGVKVLVYGRAGMGKTSLCATAPAPLIISAESGLLSIRGKKIPVALVTTLQDVYDVYNWLRTNPAAQHVQTICLDSLSEILEVILSTEKKKNRDPRQAYGGLIEEGIGLVKAFRDLPGFNVVVTAKEAAETDGITGVTRIGPWSPGKAVGPQLPYLFDEVFYASTGRDAQGQTYHYLRTKPDVQVDAKDRSGALDEIEYPDLTHIFNKIKGAI